MTNEGIYVRNKTFSRDTRLHYFVRADDWFYSHNIRTIHRATKKYGGNLDLSLAAPIMLGRFND